MYFVFVAVILKHFLCIKHGNLVFPRGYSTDATLLASYWSDPGNQVGTYTGTQFGTNGTTCLLRHHTFILHTPLFIPCSWYTYSKGFTYYSTYQGNMAEGGDPPRHGAGRGSVGASPCHDSLIFMSTHKATAARCLSRHQATYGLPPSAWPL